MHGPDVPSPIDLRLPADAEEWERTATALRPWREDFFRRFAEQIAAMPATGSAATRVLELGSGPGFLAAHLLQALPQVRLVLLDFSAAMHALARTRLAAQLDRVEFVERSFKAPGWTASLGTFDAVVTNQAVHEMRHKRYALPLHEQVRALLRPHGQYLVCDHYAGGDGMGNTELYMTVDEQREALRQAGFPSVREIERRGGMVLHAAS